MMETVCLHPHSWRKHYEEVRPLGEGRSESPLLLLKVASLEMGQEGTEQVPVWKRRQLLIPFLTFCAGLNVLPSGMSPSSVPVSCFSSWSVAYEDESEGAF